MRRIALGPAPRREPTFHTLVMTFYCSRFQGALSRRSSRGRRARAAVRYKRPNSFVHVRFTKLIRDVDD
jgi:hypothetical protein